ncbi:MAG: lysylphosphatidylglycerol synthase transmembrane domain-containing protein [Oscillochloridaceae bacterium umkhey_bin13]
MQRNQKQNHYQAILRVLITSIFIGLLLVFIPWNEILNTLATANPTFVILSWTLYYIGVALSCWKWRIILQIEGFNVSFLLLYRWYLIGAFAGNYLPTDVGGDVGRVVLASRMLGHPVEVTRSVLVERLSGLLFMIILAWFAVIILLNQLFLAFIIVLIGFLITSVFFTSNIDNPKRSSDLLFVYLWNHLPAKIHQILISLVNTRHYYRHLKPLLLIGMLSLLFQVLSGIGTWINLRAVGVDLNPVQVILVFALVSVATLLPITINGWGVREGLLVALLASFEALPSAILAGALLGRAIVLLASLPGGLFLVFERKHPRDSADKANADKHQESSS